MEIIYLGFGILFAIMILSYFSSEHSKKMHKAKTIVKKDPIMQKNKNVAIITSTDKLNQSTKKLNQLLRNKMKDEKIADSFRVSRGQMTQEAFEEKWAIQKTA